MREARAALVGVLLAALLCLPAGAEVFVLPEGLREIGAEAFAGNTCLQSVILPEQTLSIGVGAFRDCVRLESAWIPAAVEAIGDGAFDGCAGDLLICTRAGSAAERFAIANGIDYQADTVYRALLIGNSYTQNADLRLYGPENDVAAMKSCLLQYRGTPYDMRIRRDQAADQMLQCVQDCFSGAQPQDVSLLYYSGHGVLLEETGEAALLGNDGTGTLTAEALRNALAGIPGRKILIIDACYSGGFIPDDKVIAASADGENGETPAKRFASRFTAAFARMSRGTASNRFFVLTAAAGDEKSYESVLNGRSFGVFTTAFLEGCGWDPAKGRTCSPEADANGNGVITFFEIGAHTGSAILDSGQHVKVYPEHCAWFGILRKTCLAG